MLLNDPQIIADITQLHDAYERALVANDVDALNASFWNSANVVRFGVSEQLYGAEAIAAYRNDTPPVLLGRQILRRSITVFGENTATIMCEISQTVNGHFRQSRQSQVWIRFAELGWRIVSAHVSQPLADTNAAWSGYVDRAAATIDLSLNPAHRVGIVGQIQRAAQLAAPLLDFELPVGVEFAPIFTP